MFYCKVLTIRKESSKLKVINNKETDEGDTFNVGAISGSLSGALDPDSPEASQHAERYYEAVRRMNMDIDRIAKNTNFSVEEIKRIKEHVFLKEHDFGDGTKQRFDTSYDMAQSWQRLIDGKQIEAHDIVLLKHELAEIEEMNNGCSQQKAHELVNERFNYKESLEKWRKS